jgi:hypothetical protein
MVSAPPVIEAASFPVVDMPVASDVVYGSPIVGEVIPSSGCCNSCGDGVVTSAPIVEGGVIDDGFVEGGYVDAVVAEPMTVEGGIVEGEMTDGVFIHSGDFSEGTVVEEGTAIDIVEPSPTLAPVVDEAPPTPEIDSTPIEEPAVAEPPVDSPLDTDVEPPAADGNNLFEPDPVVADEPAVDEPAFEETTDDFDAGLGGAGDASEPIDAPVDDFAADPEPAEEPAPVEDAGDDLFGGDDSVPDAPADGGDDLFGGDDAAADAGGDDLFDAGADDAAGDDLFDAGADDAAGDDLFDAGADDAGADDLFDAGADDAAGDDLFDDPGAADAGDALDAVEPGSDDLDDVFGKKDQVPAGMRVWTDDTGKFKTVGRLVVIAKHHIRLLKSNGRHSTVPLNRLSNTDLDFVMAVAKRISDSKQVASL